MYGFPPDHLHRLVVLSNCYVFDINISVKHFKNKRNGEAFSLYVCVPGLHISQCFTCKCNGPVILD